MPLKTNGHVTTVNAFDNAMKISSGEMLRAAQDNRIAGGDAFAGLLEASDPVFGLSSLPFVVQSVDSAIAMNARARPLYERALAARRLKLLYMTIWPSTGIWSDQPLRSVDDLRALAVRTYDDSSTGVMRAVGAAAESLPFNEAIARVREHKLNAILTSGMAERDASFGTICATSRPSTTRFPFRSRSYGKTISKRCQRRFKTRSKRPPPRPERARSNSSPIVQQRTTSGCAPTGSASTNRCRPPSSLPSKRLPVVQSLPGRRKWPRGSRDPGLGQSAVDAPANVRSLQLRSVHRDNCSCKNLGELSCILTMPLFEKGHGHGVDFATTALGQSARSRKKPELCALSRHRSLDGVR